MRKNFSGSKECFPIVDDKLRELASAAPCLRGQLDLGTEREPRRYTVRRRGSVTKVPGHCAAILDLHAADFAGSRLEAVKAARQGRFDQISPSG